MLCLDIPLGAPHLPQDVSVIVRSAIDGYDGKIVDQGPRRLIALFDGPIRAMRCAQSVIDVLETSALQGRIGIHSGVVETSNLSNGAIGIAGQLASMAAPGSIIVTESARNIAPGSGFAFEPIGQQPFIGLDTPLELFLVSDYAAEDITTS